MRNLKIVLVEIVDQKLCDVVALGIIQQGILELRLLDFLLAQHEISTLELPGALGRLETDARILALSFFLSYLILRKISALTIILFVRLFTAKAIVSTSCVHQLPGEFLVAIFPVAD